MTGTPLGDNTGGVTLFLANWHSLLKMTAGEPDETPDQFSIGADNTHITNSL